MGLRYLHLIRRFKYPKSNGVIFRATYPELEANHIRPLLTEFPELGKYWIEGKKLLKLPNGSVQAFRHCGTMKEVTLYQGQEFHDFAYEEAGNLSEEVFEFLKQSNRSANPAIPAKCQITFNFGGSAHKWLKRRFINQELSPEESKESYHFIKALLEDNPALVKADPNYGDRILAMGNEQLKKAWRWGDADIEAGQYFDMNRELHFIEPFKIPDHWPRYCGYDWGFGHPAAWVWMAVDEQSTAYVYREWAKAKSDLEEQAAMFHSMPDVKLVKNIYAGHDCWVDKGSAWFASSKPRANTIAEEFARLKIHLEPANNARRQGAAIMRELLRYEREIKDGQVTIKRHPRLVIFKTCPMTYNSISERIYDPKDIEDVLKEDSVGGDPMIGDDCFIAGTQISTAIGSKPIEEIVPGDMVLTRRGYQPVRAAWLNSAASEVATVHFSNGNKLTGTLNHPIWLSGGFVSLDSLRYGDALTSEAQWLSRKPSYSTALNSGGIRNLSTELIESITRLVETTASEVLERCIMRFGSLFTDRYPLDTTFIMPTGIHSTTILGTWCVSMLNHILGAITNTLNPSDYLRCAPILSVSAQWHQPGIALRLAENGIVRTASIHGKTGSTLGSDASNATLNLIRFVQSSLSSVIQTAKQCGDESLVSRTLKKDVSRATKNSQQTDTQEQSTAPIVVHKLQDHGTEPTYALHVANCHEYFANGVLVKNCYDAARYSLASRFSRAIEPKDPKKKYSMFNQKYKRPSWQTV